MLLCGLLLLTSSAVAAPDAAKTKARAAVARAKAAYSASNYLEAARAYLEAHDALLKGGHPSKAGLLFNAALAYEKAGACDRTVELFTEFLRARPDASSPEIKTRLAEARRCAPDVAITTRPPGAAVIVDGRERGVSPTTIPVAAGRHTLVLKLDGHQALQHTFEVARDRPSAIALALEAQPSTASLDLVVPADSSVSIDGSASRPGPIKERLNLSPGRHEFRFERTGCVPDILTVELRAGTRRDLKPSQDCLPLPVAQAPKVATNLEPRAEGVPTSTWIAGGTAVAALGVGIAMTILHLGAASDRDALDADPQASGADIRALDNKAYSYSVGSGVGYGVAGAAAATAIVTLLLQTGSGE